MARQSAAVYRRRRLVVLLALLVVIAVVAAGVWALIARPWEGEAPVADPTETTAPAEESASPTASESPTPSESETPGIAACQAADIEVVAVTDAESYAADQLPKLSISLTNNGTKDCTINVGTTTQQFVITSGDDVWWRSTDCQENPADMIVTLTAGQTVPSATPLTWDRTRSSTTTCGDENRQRAPAGGASYHVAVSIGGFDSKGTQQFILR
ncbi:hypothetical protein [Microbacterium sp. CIAB417]|uniref:hypothetical protein n=1 Tax=Microbacterium sp. CIAB417 TaxID=2860287 RepID=UPI001FABC444|nr:hypothetical protein [Microbacterium sp. CIAB417]